MRYADRPEAGRRLARALAHLRDTDPVIVALPRGGIPVAREVADALDAPLDVLIVRKLGVPWHPEVAMGAIAEDGFRVLNDDVLRSTGVRAGSVARVEAAERAELARRIALLRGDRQRIPLTGRTTVIVDDGVATGATAEVACRAARAAGAARIVLAVPVASPDSVRRLSRVTDEVVCPWTSDALDSVGAAYRDFHQLGDDESARLLDG